MRTVFFALVSALILAAVATELTTRLWPGDWLALVLVLAITLFVNGLFNAKLAARTTAAMRPPLRGDANARPAATSERARPERARPERARQESERSDHDRSDQRERVPRGDVEQGRVKWFNRTKGFGFIIRESGEEIFVHQRSIAVGANQRRPALRDGQAVTFRVAVRDKGAQAEDVSPLDD
jgi:cold shock CspA family protein